MLNDPIVLGLPLVPYLTGLCIERAALYNSPHDIKYFYEMRCRNPKQVTNTHNSSVNTDTFTFKALKISTEKEFFVKANSENKTFGSNIKSPYACRRVFGLLYISLEEGRF